MPLSHSQPITHNRPPGAPLTGLLLLLAGLVGCGEKSNPLPGPSPTGSIAITSSTTGSSFDPDGYTVSIDGSQARAIGVNASTTYEAIPVGDYEVELAGVASNCSIQGSGSQAVTVTDGGTASAAFSITCVQAEVEQIVFQRGSMGALYTVGTDASNPVRLSGAFGFAPDVSPDGTKIVLSRGAGGAAPDIWVMNYDGSNPVQLTTSSGVDVFARWSPDGSRIAFSSTRDGNFEIYVMDADGSNPVRLTNNASSDMDPTWSPDGTRIAFVGDSEIYAMNADGSNPVRLTNNVSDDLTPDWSPDGSKIVFSSNRGPDILEIWVMNSDGSNPLQLTQGLSLDSGVEPHPTWSPDGSKIAFSAQLVNTSSKNIGVMNADGSNIERLTTGSYDDSPSWSP